jgi:hypothetical protein
MVQTVMCTVKLAMVKNGVLMVMDLLVDQDSSKQMD